MGEQDPTYKPITTNIHWKSTMAKAFLGAWDVLDDRTVTISKVELASLPGIAGKIKANQRPVLSFNGTAKKLIVNSTIGSVIASLYGPKILDWVGKRVTLYAATDRGQGGASVECVRVRPKVPPSKEKDTGVPQLPVDEAMRKRQAEAMGEDDDGAEAALADAGDVS